MSGATMTDIPALISSRICHDLISPIGAISNGLELLGETTHDPQPELALVLDSTETAKAKIAFFRLAFGNIGEGEHVVSAPVGQVMDAMFSTGRFRPVWAVEESPISRGEVKLVLLLTLATEASLKAGGSCRITRNGGSWTLSTTGPKIAPDERLWSWVTEGSETGEISARDVQFALAGETARRLGVQVTMSAGEAGMSVEF